LSLRMCFTEETPSLLWAPSVRKAARDGSESVYRSPGVCWAR
jgi:hypothetical protein